MSTVTMSKSEPVVETETSTVPSGRFAETLKLAEAVRSAIKAHEVLKEFAPGKVEAVIATDDVLPGLYALAIYVRDNYDRSVVEGPFKATIKRVAQSQHRSYERPPSNRRPGENQAKAPRVQSSHEYRNSVFLIERALTIVLADCKFCDELVEVSS